MLSDRRVAGRLKCRPMLSGERNGKSYSDPISCALDCYCAGRKAPACSAPRAIGFHKQIFRPSLRQNARCA